MQHSRFMQGIAVATILTAGCALRYHTYQTFADDVSVQKGWHVHEGKNDRGNYSVWFHEIDKPKKDFVYIVKFNYKDQGLQFDDTFLRETHRNKDSDAIDDPHQLWITQNHKVDEFGHSPSFRFGRLSQKFL